MFNGFMLYDLPYFHNHLEQYNSFIIILICSIISFLYVQTNSQIITYLFASFKLRTLLLYDSGSIKLFFFYECQAILTRVNHSQVYPLAELFEK